MEKMYVVWFNTDQDSSELFSVWDSEKSAQEEVERLKIKYEYWEKSCWSISALSINEASKGSIFDL